MAAEDPLSSKRDHFYRSVRVLLSTPVEAIDSWGVYLKLEQEAAGLLHDAASLRDQYRLQFAAHGIDVNSGTAALIQEEFGRMAVLISEYRRKIAGVKTLLQAKAPNQLVDAAAPVTPKVMGVPPELLESYAKLEKDVDAVDPHYGPARRMAAEMSHKISEAQAKFDVDLDRYLAKTTGQSAPLDSKPPSDSTPPNAQGVDRKRHALGCKAIPSDIRTSEGVRPSRKRQRACAEVRGCKDILKFLSRSGWERGRATFFARMKSGNPPPCWRDGKVLVGWSCALARWAEIQAAL